MIENCRNKNRTMFVQNELLLWKLLDLQKNHQLIVLLRSSVCTVKVSRWLAALLSQKHEAGQALKPGVMTSCITSCWPISSRQHGGFAARVTCSHDACDCMWGSRGGWRRCVSNQVTQMVTTAEQTRVPSSQSDWESWTKQKHFDVSFLLQIHQELSWQPLQVCVCVWLFLQLKLFLFFQLIVFYRIIRKILHSSVFLVWICINKIYVFLLSSSSPSSSSAANLHVEAEVSPGGRREEEPSVWQS